MPTIDDYQRQLRILGQMRSESEAARLRFKTSKDTYLDQIAKSRNLGYMGNYVDELFSRAREFSDKLDELLAAMVRGEVEIGAQEERIQGLIRIAQTAQ